MLTPLESGVFNATPDNFQQVALEVFRHQVASVEVYSQYLNLLKIDIDGVDALERIPFLPIAFFKTHEVIEQGKKAQTIFTSSGTSGSDTSRHHVASLELYEGSFFRTFNLFYGDPSRYCILALLPSYLQRSGSSLVYMAKRLIEAGAHPQSGFFLDDYESLVHTIAELEKSAQKTILLGVTYAILELANRHRLNLQHTIVMETGGMKGRSREMVRSEVHEHVKRAFGVKAVHSEYGMTELLSQAYSSGEGIFRCPPWMRVFARDPYDPFTILPCGRTGALNIIDLANMHSCAFIQTDDLGVVHPDGSFEVVGRLDNSQIRGCNLLASM